MRASLRTNVFLVALALSLLGSVMVYSATFAEYGERYLIVRFAHLGLGLAAFWVASRVRYPAWRRFSPGYISVSWRASCWCWCRG